MRRFSPVFAQRGKDAAVGYNSGFLFFRERVRGLGEPPKPPSRAR